MKAHERFLNYVSVWTTSNEDSDTIPSAVLLGIVYDNFLSIFHLQMEYTIVLTWNELLLEITKFSPTEFPLSEMLPVSKDKNMESLPQMRYNTF